MYSLNYVQLILTITLYLFQLAKNGLTGGILSCLEGLNLLDQNIYCYNYLKQTNSDTVFQPVIFAA